MIAPAGRLIPNDITENYHNSQKNATKHKKYHKSKKLPQQCQKTQNIPQNNSKIFS